MEARSETGIQNEQFRKYDVSSDAVARVDDFVIHGITQACVSVEMRRYCYADSLSEFYNRVPPLRNIHIEASNICVHFNLNGNRGRYQLRDGRYCNRSFWETVQDDTGINRKTEARKLGWIVRDIW